MKIIALSGGENTGKSHTINIVYSFLLRDGWSQVPGHFHILGNPKFEDIFDILEKDGKKIGIIGMGDFQKGNNSLRNLIDEILSKGCAVVLCACRNIPIIENAVRKYPDHIIIPKTLSTGDANNRIVNFEDAAKMIQLI